MHNAYLVGIEEAIRLNMVCPLRIPPSRNAYYSVSTHHVCETELMGLTIGWLKLPDVCGTWYVWYGMNRHMLAVILGVTSTADTFSTNSVYQLTVWTVMSNQNINFFLKLWIGILYQILCFLLQKGSTQVSRKYQYVPQGYTHCSQSCMQEVSGKYTSGVERR